MVAQRINRLALLFSVLCCASAITGAMKMDDVLAKMKAMLNKAKNADPLEMMIKMQPLERVFPEPTRPPTPMSLVSTNTPTVRVRDGDRVQLNCSVLMKEGNVIWLMPHIFLPITNEDFVSNVLRNRFQVRGPFPEAAHKQGEYNLVIFKAKFPHDHGTWRCAMYNGGVASIDLEVMSPPANPMPHISPGNNTVMNPLLSDALTFTCTADYAFPPVTLTWTRVSGPSAPYSISPQGGILGKDGRVSSTLQLTLTADNQGSTFECEGRHPASDKSVYTTSVVFSLPLKVHAAAADTLEEVRDIPINSNIAAGDLAIVAAFGVVALFVVLYFCALCLSRKYWRFDVRLNEATVDDISTKEQAAAPCNSPHVDGQLIHNRRKRSTLLSLVRKRFVRRQVFLAALLTVILLVFCLIIPTYIKGISVPILGTDDLLIARAGSMLFLDCIQQAQPIDRDLVRITWRKNKDVIYTQTFSSMNIGQPENSTVGQKFAVRVWGDRPGQLGIWPILPGEDDVYSCEIARRINKAGGTKFQQRTIGVIIVAAMPWNGSLMFLVGLGIVTALSTVAFLTYTSVRCAEQEESQPGITGEVT